MLPHRIFEKSDPEPAVKHRRPDPKIGVPSAVNREGVDFAIKEIALSKPSEAVFVWLLIGLCGEPLQVDSDFCDQLDEFQALFSAAASIW